MDGPDPGGVGDHLGEDGQEVAVEFEGQDFPAGGHRLGQGDRQRPHPGTHLEHPVAGAHPGEADDAPGGVGVGQEVLAQRPAGAEIVGGEKTPHVSRREQPHGAGP